MLPVCLLQVESSPERYGLHGDSCIHLHSNGSMLGAWYWFHHNLVAAPGNSVGSKDYVRVVPSPPLTAVERAGKLGVMNQAQSLDLCPVLYQFAVSVSRGIAPCRTVAVAVHNDHRSQWLVERSRNVHLVVCRLTSLRFHVGLLSGSRCCWCRLVMLYSRWCPT